MKDLKDPGTLDLCGEPERRRKRKVKEPEEKTMSRKKPDAPKSLSHVKRRMVDSHVAIAADPPEKIAYQHTVLRQFRAAFKKALRHVLLHYPAARVTANKEGMLLANSSPPVQKRMVLVEKS